ncbi:MAG: inorganic phosphate transporter [Candidatus Sericytochromatia bacterium]|nr:inorganic phosphate transporter [Candidatus Sericytochromatia bacterium]
MSEISAVIVFIVALALFFDFTNGFHDTANAIAPAVATGVLSPQQAVTLSAILNFVGALAVGTAVATTIGKGIIDPRIADHWLVISALTGATSWNLVTWYYGIPSSSSHALIGGIVGAAVAGHGLSAVKLLGFVPLAQGLFLSPLLGFFVAGGLLLILFSIFRRFSPLTTGPYFRWMQLLSVAGLSLSHGTNDAQKSMGIITMSLVGLGYLKEFQVPFWVMLACATAIGLGTLSGGWRIIKTMGNKITKLQPIHAFASSTAAAGLIMAASSVGLPVSTTHCMTGCIMGVGAAQRVRGVNWGVTGEVMTAWVLTIPAAALLSAGLYEILTHTFG